MKGIGDCHLARWAGVEVQPCYGSRQGQETGVLARAMYKISAIATESILYSLSNAVAQKAFRKGANSSSLQAPSARNRARSPAECLSLGRSAGMCRGRGDCDGEAYADRAAAET